MALLPGEDGAQAIGAAAFTALRLLSGALVLAPCLIPGLVPGLARRRALRTETVGVLTAWPAALAMAGYAITFSLSYVTIPAGIGALILFGTVQVLMLGVALRRGERLGPCQVGGFVAAIAGILVLIGPSVAAASDQVDPVGALLMVVAGVGWGTYTLLGRGAADPVRMTARNFVCCAPLAALLGLWAWSGSGTTATTRGVLLSVASGAITSGAGYALWYTALRGHTRTSAAAVQLLVPIIAAWGGVWMLDEELTWPFVLAAVLVLGGVGAAVLTPARSR